MASSRRTWLLLFVSVIAFPAVFLFQAAFRQELSDLTVWVLQNVVSTWVVGAVILYGTLAVIFLIAVGALITILQYARKWGRRWVR